MTLLVYLFLILSLSNQALALVFIDPALINVSGCSNTTINVNVSISGVSNVYGFQFDLAYNSTALEFINISEGSFLSNNGLYSTYWFPPDFSTSGLIKNAACVIEGYGGPNPVSGVLASINFRPKNLTSYPGTSNLVLSNVKLSDINASSVDNSTQDGQVTLTVCPSCLDGKTKACGLDVGECKQGNQICINGQWGSCIGSVDPVNEVCYDNKDNDCDGSTDEGCSDGDGGGGDGGGGGSLPSSGDYTNASQKNTSAQANYSATQTQQSNASVNLSLASHGNDESAEEAANKLERTAQETDKAGSEKKFRLSPITLFLAFVAVVLGLTFVGIIYFEKKKKNDASKRSSGLTPENFVPKESAGSSQPAVDNAQSNYYYVLNEYIQKSINSGMTKEEIRKALLSRGWPEEMINKVLDNQDIHFS